ncbi:unnamed protein product [Amaranthus hypochondriacus]
MLGKRSRPVIGKLIGVLRSRIVDSITSPRSPLDCKVLQSPRRLKNYCIDQKGGGVGLGIIVALDNKSSSSTKNDVGSCGGEILAKYAICSQIWSNPINVNNLSYVQNDEKNLCIEDEMMEEEFTYVTCHGANKSTTRVYYCGNEFAHQPKICNKIGVFNISSPANFLDEFCDSESDFLSSCCWCKKGLHGKDIYMYRGEKAFCSEECRQRQIMKDERKDKCRSEASRSMELSSSTYGYAKAPRGQIFSTGIIAI